VNGKFPVFGANGVIGRFDRFNHENEEIAMACRGATCGVVNMTSPRSWITGNAMVVRPIFDEISRRFLYYVLRRMNFSSVTTGAAQPQITRESLRNISIPLPPLPVQEAIVAILDRFDTLVNDLSNGLPAEIEARRKQYEYYRDKLLTFKEAP